MTLCQAVGCTVNVKEWIFGRWVSEIIAPLAKSLSLLFASKHHQSHNFSSDVSLRHLLGSFCICDTKWRLEIHDYMDFPVLPGQCS